MIKTQRNALLLPNAKVKIKSKRLMQRAVVLAKPVMRIKYQTERKLLVLIESLVKTVQLVCHMMSTAANHALKVKLQVIPIQ